MSSYSQKEIDEMVKALELDGSSKSTKVLRQAFIDGKYVDSVLGETFESENPATGKVVVEIASCGKQDVDLAVKAARRSFEEGVWSGLDPRDRMEILLKFASLIEEHGLELAVLDSVEAGKPIADCLAGDIPETVECFKFHAEAIDKVFDQVTPTGQGSVSMVVREPVGVCGLIVPWNFPLLMAAWKVAPSLATGNSVVLKPAELTSLSAIRLGELAKEAGIPDGVFNVVPGLGINAGSAISMHPDIDMVGFTGSTLVGRLVLKAAGDSNLKRVSLECGGKSPQIVFDDVEDIDDAIGNIMNAAFWNMGENCSCGSRLFVQNTIKDKVLEKLVTKAKTWVVGNPQKLDSKLGAMISQAHMSKVLGFIGKGKEEGAKLVFGGEQLHQSSGGHFVGITIFDGVSNKMTIAQEEIFGPVLSVIGFDTEEEVIAMANDTKYGLASSLYTSNLKRAHRIARKVKAGTVSINCFCEGNITTPFGGFKQSGFVGRDKSLFAHEQYQELKTVWLSL